MAEYELAADERAVVVLLAHGLTFAEVGARLRCSAPTAISRVRKVAKRWGVHTSAGIVGLAYRSGAIYVNPDEVAAEDTWTTRAREAGFELERRPERVNDRRHDAHQRRGEDR